MLLCHILGKSTLDRYTVVSKDENPGSRNGPTMVDCWVVRVTFGLGWYVYMMWSEITMELQCHLFQPVPNGVRLIF